MQLLAKCNAGPESGAVGPFMKNWSSRRAGPSCLQFELHANSNVDSRVARVACLQSTLDLEAFGPFGDAPNHFIIVPGRLIGQMICTIVCRLPEKIINRANDWKMFCSSASIHFMAVNRWVTFRLGFSYSKRRLCLCCVDNTFQSYFDSVCELYVSFEDLEKSECGFNLGVVVLCIAAFWRRLETSHGVASPSCNPMGLLALQYYRQILLCLPWVLSLTLLQILCSCLKWGCRFCVVQTLRLAP